MAWARKRAEGKWQGIAVHPAGHKRTQTFPRKRDAEAWAEELEATWRRDRGHDPRAGEITFSAWVVLWLQGRNVDRATRDKNASQLRAHLEPKWGTWPINAIDRLDVGGWIQGMVRADVGAHTIEGVVRTMSAIMQGAVEVGRLQSNPCSRQRLPKADAKPPRYFTEAQAALIVAELPAPWAVACDLDMHVGLRLGELLGLRASAVDWSAGLIHVRTVLTRYGLREYPKSTKSRRSVPIPDHLLDALRPHGDGLVFPAAMGGPLSDENFRHRLWSPAVALAGACTRHRDEGERVGGCRGCKLTDGGRPCPAHRREVGASATCPDCTPVPRETPHTMRHTAASWMVQRGVPLYEVQLLLGHESIRTTERYSHLAPNAHDRIRDAWRSGARTVPDEEKAP